MELRTVNVRLCTVESVKVIPQEKNNGDVVVTQRNMSQLYLEVFQGAHELANSAIMRFALYLHM